VKQILHDIHSLDKTDEWYQDKLAFITGKQAVVGEKIAAHGVRLKQLLSALIISPVFIIEEKPEVTRLVWLTHDLQLDETRNDTRSDRRNAPELDFSEAGPSYDNGLPNDVHIITESPNYAHVTTEADDETLSDDGPPNYVHIITESGDKTSSEVDRWPRRVTGNIPRSAEKVYSSFRHFYDDTDESVTSSNPLAFVGIVGEVTHDAIIALVTHEGKKLSAVPTYPLVRSGEVPFCSETYCFHERNKSWILAEDWLRPSRKDLFTTRNTSYVLNFSLEEAFSGALKHIDVRRTIVHPKHRHTTSVDEITLNVKAKKGFWPKDTVRYVGAGSQSANHTESLIFIFKYVSIKMSDAMDNTLKLPQKKHDAFERDRLDLTHAISVSIKEASEGWKREIRHPSGVMIDVYAQGPTKLGHTLMMMNCGLPSRWRIPGDGNLVLRVYVKDIEEVSVHLLNHLKIRGGAYYAQIRGREDCVYASFKESPPQPV